MCFVFLYIQRMTGQDIPVVDPGPRRTTKRFQTSHQLLNGIRDFIDLIPVARAIRILYPRIVRLQWTVHPRRLINEFNGAKHGAQLTLEQRLIVGIQIVYLYWQDPARYVAGGQGMSLPK